MIKSPYGTLVGKTYDVNAITEALIRMRNQHYYGRSLLETPYSDVQIHMVTEEWKTVPFFSQVITFEDPTDPERTLAYVDVRQMATVDREGRVRFKSSNEKLFTTVRALLTLAWQQDKQSAFLMGAEVPCKIYAHWMVRAISRTYPSNPSTNVRLTVIAAFFFMSQLLGGKEMTEKDGMMVASRIARITKIPEDVCKNIILDIGDWINSTAEYCDAIVKHAENLGLENMNPAKLYTTLGGTWYGAGSSEHIAVAVEYIPTFYAMVLVACQDNSYRKTMIGEIVKDNMRDPNLRQLQASMKPLILL